MFKAVLKPRDVEHQVLNYVPQAIIHHVPEQVLPFLKDQREATKNEFSLSQITADSTGLSEIESKNFADKVETVVLEKLKAIEEKAYKEAYSLGLTDGQTKAYKDSTDEIKVELDRLRSIGDEVIRLKSDMTLQNEAHLVKTIFHIAKSLAMHEIAQDSARIIDVLKKAVDGAQSEEEIKIKLNPKDFEFIEKVKTGSGHPLERLPKVKVESSESISLGGCIVETNYGVIDATIEQRIQKLWNLLEEKIPKDTNA